jgi:hypothetical protein
MLQTVMVMRLTTNRCYLFNATFARPDNGPGTSTAADQAVFHFAGLHTAKSTVADRSVRSTRLWSGTFWVV